MEERYPGLDRVSVSQPVGAPQAVITEQLEWFAAELMPAFRGASMRRRGPWQRPGMTKNE